MGTKINQFLRNPCQLISRFPWKPLYCIGVAINCIGVAYLLHWCCLSTVLVLPLTVLVLPIYCIGVAINCIGVAINCIGVAINCIGVAYLLYWCCH